jgi:hypothetical protein
VKQAVVGFPWTAAWAAEPWGKQAGVAAETVEVAASRLGDKPWREPLAEAALGTLALAALPEAMEVLLAPQGSRAEPPVELLAAAWGTCEAPQKYWYIRRASELGAEEGLPERQVVARRLSIQKPSARAAAGIAS